MDGKSAAPPVRERRLTVPKYSKPNQSAGGNNSTPTALLRRSAYEAVLLTYRRLHC